MKITKFEQSGFVLESENSKRLAVDIGAYTPLEKLEEVSVDSMLVSHLHGDHFSVDQIKKLSPKKLYLNAECIEILGEENLSSEVIEVKIGDILDIDGVKVTIFDVDHGPNVTVRPKENFGFIFEVDGEKIYFAGDMFYPSGVDVSALEVDVALLPVGTFYTFGPEEALAFAKQFKKIGKVIPMHYQKYPDTREKFVNLAVDDGLNTETFPL